jgi:hypothetical protein
MPGCHLWLGAKREGDNPGLHSARYDFNDRVLPIGASLWVRLVQQALSSSATRGSPNRAMEWWAQISNGHPALVFYFQQH